jgi:hypothetical protein
MIVDKPILLLVALPFVLPPLSVMLAWTAFFVGTATGTPLVSFTYAVSAMKRAWRAVVGWILIAIVLCSTIAMIAR